METTAERDKRILDKEYEDFKKSTIELIKSILGVSVQITQDIITKYNGQKLDAMIIRPEGQDVAPTFYFNEMYADFLHGRSQEDIVDAVVSQVQKMPDIKLPEFTKEEAFAHMKASIVNYDANEEMLKSVPHKRILDMAIYPRFFISNEGSFKITNQILDKFGLTKEEALDIALRNSRRDNYRLRSMNDVIREMMGEDMSEEMVDEMFPSEEIKMFVYSSNAPCDAAVCLAMKDKLTELTDQLGPVHIIPSSRHEILIIPTSVNISVKELKQMVHDVNRTQVAPEDVLSDNVYHFDSITKKLTIADEPVEKKNHQYDVPQKARVM